MIQNDVFSSRILHGRNTNFVKETKKVSAVKQSTKTHEYKLGCSWLRIYKNPLAFFVVSKFGPFFRETSVI